MKSIIMIDAQNLYYSARRMNGGRVDYNKLKDKIVESEPESLRIVYLVRGDDYDSSGFENLLREYGYRISPRTGQKIRENGKTKMKYDNHTIRISLDAAINFVDQYDKLIVISGDVDFSDLFLHLDRLGKQTEFWSFDRKLSPDLLQSVGKVVFLDTEIIQSE